MATDPPAAPHDDIPPHSVLAHLVPYLTETLEVVDRKGAVRWVLGPRSGALGDPRVAERTLVAQAHPDDVPQLLDFRDAVLESEPGWHGSLVARLGNGDGTWRRYSVEVVNHLGDPDLDGIVVKTRELPTGPLALSTTPDVSDEAMAESIAEAVPVALLVLDGHGRIEFANHAARQICDLPPGPPHGRHLPDLAVDADRPGVSLAVRALLDHIGSRTVVFGTRGWQGRRELRLVEARLLARGTSDRPSTIVVTLDDVTDRHRREAELRRRATRDPLTGLLNRAALLEEMEARLQRGPLTAIYCDLDDFKTVNDTFGHAGGDELLVEVARLLTSLARSTDAIGRIGGDEFVVVCDGLTRPHTAKLLARLGEAFDAGLGVRISVGVATGQCGGSAADLLARADRAMYEDKRRGRPSRGSTTPQH